MPYRTLISGEIFTFSWPVVVGAYGYLVAFNVGTAEALIAVGGATLCGMGMRLIPVLKGWGDWYLEFRGKFQMQTLEIAARAAELEKRADRNADSIVRLGGKVSAHDRELTLVSTALAEKVGLIAPIIPPETLGPDPAGCRDVAGGVLVVEDDPYTIRAYHGLLCRSGFTVCSVSDVEGARERLADGPACVILDLKLPGAGGEDLLREIRRAGLPIRVVVTTGIDDRARLDAIADMRPDVLLRKPVLLESLIAAVRPPLTPGPGAAGRSSIIAPNSNPQGK
jgi:CheY-like chemotaxis protein